VGLISAVVPLAATLVATVIAVWQLGRFRIHRVKLTIPDLPPALRGFTIVHLSDLHIGKLTRGKVLDDIVAATNSLDADLILLTGDLINMSLEDLPRAFELLRAVKARYGLYLCEGNHDLLESRTGFETAAKASGLPFLLNESATLSVKGQRVQVLGLRWGEGMGRDRETPGSVPDDALHRLLDRRDPGDFTILLAHHPEAFDAAAEAGIPLTLAGHTHGGQLMLSRSFGFGPWFYRYWSGLYEKGSSRLVVSNGAGNWFPLRIGAPAEIIHLTLE
jgi:predicted MPP superfamily phosphohydrolase